MLDQSRHDTMTTWADVTMATATASMELASGIMAANLALWDRALHRTHDFATTSPPPAAPPEPHRPARDAVARHPVPGRSEPHRGRSWYRAPYRSPFDPAFWLTPGHPVDHAASWLAPAAGFSAMLPRAAVPGFAASQQQDWLSAWSPPWLRPFMQPPHVEASAAATNVMDFSGAYSAYRSAGGHAVAQIAQDVMTAAQRSVAEQTMSAIMKSWPLPFPLSLWMPR